MMITVITVIRYGHLTWEWVERIRGYAHPLIFAVLYLACKVTHIDYPWVIVRLFIFILVKIIHQINGPKMLQGVFSGIGDIYLYKMAEKWSGKRVALWTVF